MRDKGCFLSKGWHERAMLVGGELAGKQDRNVIEAMLNGRGISGISGVFYGKNVGRLCDLSGQPANIFDCYRN